VTEVEGVVAEEVADAHISVVKVAVDRLDLGAEVYGHTQLEEAGRIAGSVEAYGRIDLGRSGNVRRAVSVRMEDAVGVFGGLHYSVLASMPAFQTRAKNVKLK
jgi:hypothetical protein